MANSWIGRDYKRKEDHRLVTGVGEYIADIDVPGALHVKFVRSQLAHGTIDSIDTSAAKALPGVVGVWTGEDIKTEIRSLPTKVTQPLIPANYPEHWPLAVDRVKFNGEPVAVIVAEDKYVAQDAADLVVVNLSPLPVLTDPEEAMKPDAPILHPKLGTNIMFASAMTGGETEEEQLANEQNVAAIFDDAPITLKERFRTHRCGVTPLETRGAIAQWDDRKGLRVWMTTQRPHIDRLVFADHFDIPQNKVHVSAPTDQGGAFGVKAPVYREPIIIVYLSMLLRKPLRWIESREEHLMAVSQERDQIHDLEFAADENGRILALRDNIIADNGDGCEGVFWGYIMPLYGAAMVPNGYDIPNCHIHLSCPMTNKSALSPARAFGTLPGRFAVDRMVDMLAKRVGKEAADIRRLNMISKLPYDTATGTHYDYADYIKVWDKLIDHVDLPAFRKKQAEFRESGKYIGIGFAISVHASGVSSQGLVPMEGQPGYGSATVKIDALGTVRVFEGDAPQGQGHETTMSQIAADTFGIQPELISVLTGDSETAPFASGTFGARGGSYTASAVAKAAIALRDKMSVIALHDAKLEGGVPDVEFSDGRLTYRPSGQSLGTFQEVAERIIMRPLDLPEGVDANMEHTAFFEAVEPMMSFDALAIQVEVDTETGHFSVDDITVVGDVGKVINPQIVEGQVHGGVVQGLSNAMFEEFVYDENGQQLSTTLENYKLANAADVSNVTVLHANTPCLHTPLGTRGMGEGTPGPVPGALCNAICDALSEFDIEITELPIRPDRLWQLLQAAPAKAAE